MLSLLAQDEYDSKLHSFLGLNCFVRTEFLELLGPQYHVDAEAVADNISDLIFKSLCFRGAGECLKVLDGHFFGPFPILRTLLQTDASIETVRELAASLAFQFPKQDKLYHLLMLASGKISLDNITLDGDGAEGIEGIGERTLFAILFCPDYETLDTTLRRIHRVPSVYGLRVYGLGNVPFVQELIDLNQIDIQSICLFAKSLLHGNGNGNGGELVIDERIVEIYRDYLDSVQLFGERARFDRDLGMGKRVEDPKVMALHCNYCGKDLFCANNVGGMIGSGVGGGVGASGFNAATGRKMHQSNTAAIHAVKNGPATIPKACHSCGKPLPRCAVCHLYLMSTAGSSSNHSLLVSWCLVCGHGGHSSHVMDWFKVSEKCPVSDCDCKCMRTRLS